MPIIRQADAPIFRLPGLTVHGLASPQRGATETCVWRITLAADTPGFPHRVTREEIFVVVSGRAVATLAGATHPLEPGDALLVPAHTEFALANPSDEPLEALVVLPIGGQAVTAEGTFTPPWAA